MESLGNVTRALENVVPIRASAATCGMTSRVENSGWPPSMKRVRACLGLPFAVG